MVRFAVLSVSCDHRLLAARQRALEQGGFAVTSTGSTHEALRILAGNRFDGVVIGQEFSLTERQLFAADVGERWGIPVLVIDAEDEDYDSTARPATQVSDGLAELVRKLRSLFSSPSRRSA